MDTILNGTRFDLFAKYIYAKYFIRRIDSHWFIELYRDHISVLNGGWEHPGIKCSLDDFVEAYNTLIAYCTTTHSIPNTTDIRVNGRDILVDGAHRFVLAYMLNLPLYYVKDNTLDFVQGYNYLFFQNRHRYGIDYLPENVQSKIPKALSPTWMDEMAREACHIHLNMYVISLFPCSTQVPLDALNEVGQIVYTKSVEFTQDGLLRFIYELYDGETWHGYTRETKARDVSTNALGWTCNFVFFIPNSGINMTHLKANLRSQCGGRHSMHINDTHEEAIRYAHLILNDNSIHHLNYGKALSLTNLEHFKYYRDHIATQDTCIDSSFVWALYGLREAKDLDFLCRGTAVKSDHPDIHIHNSELKYYPCSLDDILYDPRKHFYTYGCKVATLEIVASMKRVRNEPKDQRDIELMTKTLS